MARHTVPRAGSRLTHSTCKLQTGITMGITDGGSSTPKGARSICRQTFLARLYTLSSSNRTGISDYIRTNARNLPSKSPSDPSLVCALLQTGKGKFDEGMLDDIVIQTITCNENLVNERGFDQATPLHAALVHQRKAIVDSLITKGADMEARDAKSRLPLHYAAMIQGTELIDSLKLGDDSPLARAQDCDGRTAIAIACKYDNYHAALHLLSKFPTTALCADDHLRTPFHIAASRGQLTLVEAIYKKLRAKRGASPDDGPGRSEPDAEFSINQQTRAGYTALHLASAKGHLDIVKFLLSQGANPTIVSQKNEICLWQAVRFGHPDVARRLLSEPSVCEKLNDRGKDSTLLSFACRPEQSVSCRLERLWAVSMLLHAGARCAASNKDGSTAITETIRLHNRDALNKLLRSYKVVSDIDQVILYTDHGGNQSTALHVACQYGNLRAVKMLLRMVSSPDHKDTNGRTSLHQAASQGDYDIFQALLFANSNINARDGRGWTPLHYACYETENRHRQSAKDEQVALLETALWTTRDSFSHREDYDGIIKLLSRHNAQLSAQTVEGDSALHLAAMEGHESRLDSLFNSFPSLRVSGLEEALNLRGETALECALHGRHYRIAEKLAVRMGGVQFKDKTSQTRILQHLVKDGQFELVASLLYKDAYFKNVGRCETVSPHATALELASFRGLIDLVRSLLQNTVPSPARDASIQAAYRVCNSELFHRSSREDSGDESDASLPNETQSLDYRAILDLLQWPPSLANSKPYTRRLQSREPEQPPAVLLHYNIMLLHLGGKELCQYSLPLGEFIKDDTNCDRMTQWQWRRAIRDVSPDTKSIQAADIEWIHLPANNVSVIAIPYETRS